VAVLVAAEADGGEGAARAVEIAADAERFPDRAVSLTEMGGYALAGSFDHLAFNAPERWIGGVHLTARRHWRYDPRLETLTPG
jgi:hypothetical protein